MSSFWLASKYSLLNALSLHFNYLCTQVPRFPTPCWNMWRWYQDGKRMQCNANIGWPEVHRTLWSERGVTGASTLLHTAWDMAASTQHILCGVDGKRCEVSVAGYPFDQTPFQLQLLRLGVEFQRENTNFTGEITRRLWWKPVFVIISSRFLSIQVFQMFSLWKDLKILKDVLVKLREDYSSTKKDRPRMELGLYCYESRPEHFNSKWSIYLW